MNTRVLAASPILWFLLLLAGCQQSTRPSPVSDQFTMTNDGGWCWFQDERAIVDQNLLVVGSVATGHEESTRSGNVEVHWRNLVNGESGTAVLHANLGRDDHNVPAFLVLPDGRLLAVYSGHGQDRLVRMRRSLLPGIASAWGPETTYEAGPEAKAGVTYSNLHEVHDDEGHPVLYDFYRGAGWDPNVLRSKDSGANWESVGRIMAGPGRPYLKYASDDQCVHFVATEQHPRDAHNSLWHGYLQGQDLHDSSGEVIGYLGSEAPTPEQYTRIFAGRSDAVAWPADLQLDSNGRPVVIYTVQIDGQNQPRGKGGRDHRFRYARWTGQRWLDFEAGHAGRRLYPGEDDYTGLAAIDPVAPNVIYISTDADPMTGKPLMTEADGLRHRELFMGRSYDGGRSWDWSPLTEQSIDDNIRPIAVAWGEDRTILLWLQGSMKSYTDYEFQIQGRIIDHRLE